MHIYNWYHSDITGIHYVHEYVTVYYRAIPLLSASLFPIPFCHPSISLYLLGTLLAVIGSHPPRSQVTRKLIFPFPSPYPYTPHSKIPTPRGLPDPNIHSLGRHREPGSQDPAQASCRSCEYIRPAPSSASSSLPIISINSASLLTIKHFN
jgi:hypothetical protein